MRSRTGIPIFVWLLVGLLALSILGIRMGSGDQTSFPSATSYRPSGTRAFADLLGRLGYNVTISTTRQPDLGPEDLAIVYRVWQAEPG